MKMNNSTLIPLLLILVADHEEIYNLKYFWGVSSLCVYSLRLTSTLEVLVSDMCICLVRMLFSDMRTMQGYLTCHQLKLLYVEDGH